MTIADSCPAGATGPYVASSVQEPRGGLRSRASYKGAFYGIYYMGASINRGPQNRPKYIMVLIIGATKMGPLIFGKQPYGIEYMVHSIW